MSATSASQSTESSYAFLRRPLRRLEKVTCRLILISMRFSSTLPLPISDRSTPEPHSSTKPVANQAASSHNPLPQLLQSYIIKLTSTLVNHSPIAQQHEAEENMTDDGMRYDLGRGGISVERGDIPKGPS